jgi:hypothetical protein
MAGQMYAWDDLIQTPARLWRMTLVAAGMERNGTLIRPVRAVLWDNVEGDCFRVASSLAGI